MPAEGNASDSNSTSAPAVMFDVGTAWIGWSESQVVTVYMLLITVVLGLPGLVGNLWVAVTIIESGITNTHSPYIFILSLSMSDCFSLVSRPFMITIALFIGPTFHSHWITDVGTLWMFYTTINHFLVIAINRYWSVTYLNSYKRMFTHRTCSILAVCCWMVGYIVTIPQQMGLVTYTLMVDKYTFLYDLSHGKTKDFYRFSLGMVCCFLLVMMYCYFWVIKEIREKIKVFASSQITPHTGADNEEGGSKIDKQDGVAKCKKGKSTSRHAVGWKKQEISFAIQFGIITVVFAGVIWFFFVTLMLSAAGIRSPVITMVNNTVLTMNFCCNPLIYIIFNKTLREKMFDLVRKSGRN